MADELLERSQVVVDLDAAQVEGWVSGLFAAWDHEAESEAFVRRCAAEPGEASAVLLAGLAYMADGDLARSARRAFDSMASRATEVAGSIGQARAAQAWELRATWGRSLVIAFRRGTQVDHAILAELDPDGLLIDLRLSGPPDELLDPDILGSIEVGSVEAAAALSALADAWQASVAAGTEPTPEMLANQRLVAQRLDDAGVPVDEWFASGNSALDLSRGMTPSEVDDADRAALATLRAAVGDPPTETSLHPAWTEVFRVTAAGVSPRERQALLWLEWADWLGAAIGLLRTDDVTVDGSWMVDAVNRCPEVSSTIHADDREYAEWAFTVALDHLEDRGAIRDGRFGSRERSALHVSLFDLWSPPA